MKSNSHVARNAAELAVLLGLTPADAAEMDLRRQVNDKIIDVVQKSGLTHAQVAKAAGMSRSRLTTILNRNTSQVSTDLMLHILAALGYRATISFARIPRAA